MNNFLLSFLGVIFVFSNYLLSQDNCNEVRVFPFSLKETVEQIDGEECLVFRNENNEIWGYTCPAEGTCVDRTRIEPDINSKVYWQFPAFDERGVKFQILPPKDGEEIPFKLFIKMPTDKNDGEMMVLWKGENWIFKIPKGAIKLEEVKGKLETLQSKLSKYKSPDYDLIKAFQYFLDYFPTLENYSQYPELSTNIDSLLIAWLPHDLLDFSKIYAGGGAGGLKILCAHCRKVFCDMTVCIYCGAKLICNSCPFMIYCMDCCVYCYGGDGVPASF
jgi:hypothetical protein